MTSSPPPPIEEPLNTWFAVQLLPHETTDDLIKGMLRVARDARILFRRVEFVDSFTLGVATYARMRADLKDAGPLMDKLHMVGYSVIHSVAGEYIARFKGGRIGKISHMVMHAAPKLGQSRMYRATKIKSWEKQFAA